LLIILPVLSISIRKTTVSMALVALFGEQDLTGKAGPVATSTLEGNDVVGIYFSAHWCPPCRGFTPVLAKNYAKIKENGKAFEIVFVSSDREEAACQDYYNEMPWLLLPFSLREKKDELAKKYGVSGIPTLVLVDAKTGETISKDGRKILTDDANGDKFPWK